MHVRFVLLSAERIFNLASPRLIPEIAKRWKGKETWWNAKYDPVRDIMEESYVRLFNAATGHYRLLEESILRDGVTNPVMLVTGRLQRRSEIELPPHLRNRPRNIVCEYVGGSRLYVAAKHRLLIPAIVNDFGNVFADGELLPTRDDAGVRSKFSDQPRKLFWNHDGSVYANLLPFSHFPEADRKEAMQTQIRTRKGIIQTVQQHVNDWMKEND